jgi:hypothetical protein
MREGICDAVRGSARPSAGVPCTGRSSKPKPKPQSRPRTRRRRPRRIEVPGRDEDAEGDRQVTAVRFLGQGKADARLSVARLLKRELEAAHPRGGAHPARDALALGVGQAQQRVARQAVAEMDLGLDFRCVEAASDPAVNRGQADATNSPRRGRTERDSALRNAPCASGLPRFGASRQSTTSVRTGRNAAP